MQTRARLQGGQTAMGSATGHLKLKPGDVIAAADGVVAARCGWLLKKHHEGSRYDDLFEAVNVRVSRVINDAVRAVQECR